MYDRLHYQAFGYDGRLGIRVARVSLQELEFIRIEEVEVYPVVTWRLQYLPALKCYHKRFMHVIIDNGKLKLFDDFQEIYQLFNDLIPVLHFVNRTVNPADLEGISL